MSSVNISVMKCWFNIGNQYNTTYQDAKDKNHILIDTEKTFDNFFNLFMKNSQQKARDRKIL